MLRSISLLALILGSSLAAQEVRLVIPPTPLTDYALYKRHLIQFEGYRQSVYSDLGRTWAVGIGHSFGTVKPRRLTYTPAEIDAFFCLDLARALDAARAAVRDFDDLPQDVRVILVGLAWTCGPTGLKQWRNLCLAVGSRAYNASTVELTLSRWWGQVSPDRRETYLRVLAAHR